MARGVFDLPDQQIAVVLPADVVKQLKARAHAEGDTLRVTILKALRQAGYRVSEAEFADRRREAARARAELYRKAKEAAREGRL